MANTVYDPDADQAHDASHLKAAEQQAAQAPYDREFGNIVDNYGETGSSPLDNQEDQAADDTLGKGYNPGKKGRFSGKGLNMSTKRKILLIGGATGGLGVVALLVFLFILASSLAIPDLAQNITTYEFARVTRDYAKTESRLTTEKLAVDATNDSTFKALRTKYISNPASKVSDQWKKLDKYRPEKVMKNLISDNNFKITYARSGLGRLQLKGVTLGDRTYLPVQRSALQRFTPGLNSVLEFKDSVSLSKTVAPALDSALRAKDVGPIVRGAVAKKIRQELGISLIAWTLGKYKGKNEAQARLEEARQKAAAIDEKTPVNDAVTSTEKEAVQNAEDASEKVLKDDKLLQQTINNGGVASSVKSAISDALAKTPLQEAVSVANPVYGIAMPMCIVYDGSLNHSGSTIDRQTTQQQSAYYYVSSAADQLKTGSPGTSAAEQTELGSAARATADDLGDVNKSKVMIRANGGNPDTSDTVSAEASAGGEYTLLDATPGIPSAVAGTINSLADDTCPYLTNIWGGIGLGVLNIAVGFFTGGASAAGEKAAGEAATTVIEKTAGNLAQRLLTKAITSTSKVKSLVYDTGKSAAKVAAATVVAKLIVNARAGQINGGLTQGTNLADEADSGGNIQAGEIDRQGQYGRALTPSEVAQSDATDQKQITNRLEAESPFERYLATDNAHSLLSRMALSVNSNLNTSIFRSLISLGGMMLHPMTYAGSLVTSLSGSAHAAASDHHYGNVQFGWSDDEQALINKTESYHSSLENQATLDASGKEDEIAGKYDKCFTGKLSDLLSNGDIVRDADGHVVPDQGLCAPNNLGPNNPDYGDLVFRYRLAKSYENTLAQLTDEQEVTSSSTGDSSSSSDSNLNTSAAEQAAKSASSGGTTVGYSLWDASGTNVSSYNQDATNYGASITKSMLLVAYLNQIGSGDLSATAKSNLTAMIENSDNAAANWVYHHLDKPSSDVSDVATDAGMSSFKLDTSDATYVLGQSTVSAADFAKFFAKINTMLPASQQSFGLDLLSHLSSADQKGLLQAGLPGTVYSKEGWKPEPSGARGAPYVVNQAAQFTANGRTYGVAVTVGGTKDQASGEAIVKSIVSALIK